MTVLAPIAAVFGIIGTLVALHAWRTNEEPRLKKRQKAFTNNREVLAENQLRYNRRAFAESPESWKIECFPLLTRPSWLPSTAIDVNNVKITEGNWRDGAVSSWAQRRYARRIGRRLGLPRQSGYGIAVKEVGGLSKLFPGTIYRLVDLQFENQSLHLEVVRDDYFGYMDTSEVLGYEAVSSRLELHRQVALRTGPFNLRNRVASA